MAGEPTGNKLLDLMERPDQLMVERIGQLARITMHAYTTQFKLTEFRQGAKPNETITGVNSVAPSPESIFIELLRADARDGKLAGMLRGGGA